MFYSESTLQNVVFVLLTPVVIIFLYFKWKFQYWKRRNVPYFEPKIPFGNLESPFSVPLGDKVAEIYNEAKSRGWKYCGMYTLVTPAILILDLDLVKHVLTKDFQHFTDRGGYTNEKDDPVGCHLFAMGGQKWRNLRAKLTPTFTSGKLKAMFQTLVDCGLVLEKYIEENIKHDQPVDIKSILACFSTDVIGSCAFGLECNSFKEPDSLFRRYGNSIFTITKSRALKGIVMLNFPDFARFLGLRQVSKDISDFFTKMIKDTVSYRDENKVYRKDFLQLLMEIRRGSDAKENGHSVVGDGNTLSLEEMVAQSFVFFAAGFETSSTTMTFALFELAIHPEIQNRLRAEISEVLARNDNKITYDSISEMKYLEQVIDETLRKRSAARLLQRVCISDYKIPGEHTVIEKGTRVFVSIKGIQHDEEYWEDPETFDPERFNEENKKKMNQYTSMPFGQGPRACIGERFGLMQVKVGLTCLLRKFKVRLNERTKLPLKNTPTALVSTAEGGIWLNLEKI